MALLVIRQNRVTKRIREQAIRAYLSLGMKKYLCERNGWSKEVLDIMDWCGVGQALNAKSHDMRVPVVKFKHGWLNVGR